MSELRRDPITGRWNIINTDEPMGPDDFEIEPHATNGGLCPFCPGQESLTPVEIMALRPPGSQPNGPGWQLRVVPNKFPALQVEGDLNHRGEGIYDYSNGLGAHEVIIETPDHHKHLADFTHEEMLRVLGTYKARMLDLRGDQRLKYSLVFKNYGRSAGASLAHPHSQLIALPIVPKRVGEELQGALRYHQFRDRCPFCDMLNQELEQDQRIVAENKSFVAFCPYVSSFPFEIWLLPRHHASDFAQSNPETLDDFGRLLQQMLARMRKTLRDPSYNYILHSGPSNTAERADYHWHLELIPRLIRVAGFEWGTGFYINPTPPELAAKALRAASLA